MSFSVLNTNARINTCRIPSLCCCPIATRELQRISNLLVCLVILLVVTHHRTTCATWEKEALSSKNKISNDMENRTTLNKIHHHESSVRRNILNPPHLRILHQEDATDDTTTTTEEERLHSTVDNLETANYIAESNLPTEFGHFRLRAYRSGLNKNGPYVGNEPCLIYCADKPPFGKSCSELAENVPLRVHDQCFTSEVFYSQRCDCKEQLLLSMKYIQKHGGAIIYLQQEGRGIGLANKIAAYELQDMGMDTVDANLQLGLPEDCRKYGVIPSILQDMNIGSIRLLTNNPLKVERLTALGVSVVGTIPVLVPEANVYNRKYLETKQERMRHSNLDKVLSNNHLTPLVTNQQTPPPPKTNQHIL